ncbi:60S ribosomal subunit assembly/export protein LOC1 [Nadsonia fulvescens var. elongata DSM 6958]|uniref:60S ribosomal subunit assembly/export protein LOC1 n=1 Tax=Nadsonia fulvescens var. elongata DSM 6958 TaxID=857566 RepID=A0A1E3PDF2_9ASCO|nr:60S ribosomal subunit assembly/export protein LOC1 [Nadsonia fulvescens var. elongata DSM 6958]
MVLHKKKAPTVRRENVSELSGNKQASNQLAVKSTATPKQSKYNHRSRSGINGVAKKVKKPRVYTEKELGIPKLNKSIDPEGIKRPKGKKGKVFADEDAMTRILLQVNEAVDNRNASKLERARALEAIRESKRKEIEAKEEEKKQALDSMKSEIKNKKHKLRKETKKADVATIDKKSEGPAKKRKSVSFK